ncbi:MAG TPA: transglutaminase-like domain-containing protein [Acidimicrobiia bacterium]|nr:transglutaminase-like domain-containing protein [Acidimicrobiia bacterium]
MDDTTLQFYATAAPITALPFREFPAQLADLPHDPMTAGEVVRGLLIHRDWAPVMGQQFSPERVEDQQLRSTRDVVARILELFDAPLTTERQLSDRMVGVCRHFATLHTALLRHAGVPARARVGFGGYFEAGWVDHWITEWWNGERWVRSDEQIFPQAAEVLGLTFDAHDQPAGEFLTGAEAWQRCRAGTEDPNQFGIFDLRGLFFIVGSVIQDLGALNKVELLPWDIWGRLEHGPGWQPTDAELAHIDALAELVVRDDLGELRSRFAEPDVTPTSGVTSMYDSNPTVLRISTSASRP